MADVQKPDNLAECIERCGRGDHDAFQALFETMHDRVFRYLLSRSRTREDALDLTQEIFIDLWRALPNFRYQTDGQFFAFVFTIVRRKLAKHYTSVRQSVPLDETYSTEHFTLNHEDYRYLLKSLEQLPEKHQELMRLRYWADLPWGEIAAILNISENLAKVWHNRALKKLHMQLPL